MTDDARPTPLPPRPNGEGPGTVLPAMVPTRERDLWLVRRRALLQEVRAIEQFLGINEKPRSIDGANKGNVVK